MNYGRRAWKTTMLKFRFKQARMTAQLSIFTPTMNRQKNIKIICEYLAGIGFGGGLLSPMEARKI